MVAPSQTNEHRKKYALAVSDVCDELIKAYDAGDTLNFTKLKGRAAKKYKLQGIPKLSDILQALPIGYRSKLWPFLMTKPVRTASGVAVVGACKTGRDLYFYGVACSLEDKRLRNRCLCGEIFLNQYQHSENSFSLLSNLRFGIVVAFS